MQLSDLDALTGRVHARLDRSLEAQADRPVTLALSGGGDSLALLAMTSDWARRRGRALLALTVDHGLNSDSRDWTRRAGDQARALGADWRGLAWTGPKPTTGLPAAARQARHSLIADAAREAGACVILFAHTADDVAENDWMRRSGTPIGRLHAASPSPAWPEGRDLVLLRPLIEERRDDLRAWLRSRGVDWIEDPANVDLRYARSRARMALAGAPPSAPAPAPASALASRLDPEPMAACGVIVLPRSAPPQALAAAICCSSGGSTPPRGRALARAGARLAEQRDAVFVVGGARVEAGPERLLVLRQMRGRDERALQPCRLGEITVWDGRFEVSEAPPSAQIAPALGRMAGLTAGDRAWLSSLPPAARAAFPIILRPERRPELAFRAARLTPLVPARFELWSRLASGETPQESQLAQAMHGATPWNHLF
ncbi:MULTISPECIES: tRNA lysidine(34) synthetase TilS [unclassified Brevundimonas]|uniref:tRNA lysidine(34) synthetase TilS n=1 Tax=unclassified Brevundimonas TaxID=2622653 RepID=UPI00143128EA|nr:MULTISPECIES: tRNA lysidine(34) synthetase TilS [unclassified Brevundimonas]